MSTTDTFLAVFLGSKTSAQMASWNALPEEKRLAKMQEGMAAWKAWAEKHHDAIVSMGGPLGQTKKVSSRGIEDTSNEMTAYTLSGPLRAMRRPSCSTNIHTLRSFPENP